MNPRLVDEICLVGKLESYRNTLEKILVLIHDNGCKVSTRYDVGFSNIEINAENGQHIRISLKEVKEPLHIVWKLLHEYGHHLSGPKKPEDLTIEREELAWKYADALVMEYPDLVVKIDDYKRCKEESLNSYRQFLNNI